MDLHSPVSLGTLDFVRTGYTGIYVPITDGDLTDDLHGEGPVLTTTAILLVTQDLGQAGALQERDLGTGGLLLLVAGSSIYDEDVGNLAGTLNPASGGGRETLGGEGIVVGSVDLGVGGWGRRVWRRVVLEGRNVRGLLGHDCGVGAAVDVLDQTCLLKLLISGGVLAVFKHLPLRPAAWRDGALWLIQEESGKGDGSDVSPTRHSTTSTVPLVAFWSFSPFWETWEANGYQTKQCCGAGWQRPRVESCHSPMAPRGCWPSAVHRAQPFQSARIDLNPQHLCRNTLCRTAHPASAVVRAMPSSTPCPSQETTAGGAFSCGAPAIVKACEIFRGFDHPARVRWIAVGAASAATAVLPPSQARRLSVVASSSLRLYTGCAADRCARRGCRRSSGRENLSITKHRMCMLKGLILVSCVLREEGQSTMHCRHG